MTDGDDAKDLSELRSAEEWLAERGITREAIRAPAGDDAAAPGTPPAGGSDDADDTLEPPRAREVVRLATEAPPTSREAVDDGAGDGADTASGPASLGDEVANALGFIQRSTARTPASSGRLARKLRGRGVPAAAVKIALEQAAERGLVNDPAMAAALADEGRAKGHAARRIREDLRRREFDQDVIDEALARHRDKDPEAVAFDVAQRKVRSYGDVDAETAFRRLVGHLARRGHGPHIARKVARQVVFNDREDDRVAGH